jgi:hypothetical protein
MPDEPNRPDTPNDPAEEPSNGEAPDFFTGLWRRTRDRRTVQLTLAYLGLGYFLIVFASKAFGDNPLIPTIVSNAWVVYWLGLPVVVFAIPLFLTGTHRYRSGLIGGVIVTSLLAGMYLRGMLSRPPAPGEDDADSIATAEVGPNGATLGEMSGGGRPVQPLAALDSGPSGSLPPANVARSDSGVPPTEIVSSTDEPGPVEPAPAEAAPLDRMKLLYGESDRVSLDTAPGPHALFEGFENPISLRLYPVSPRLRLNVEADGSQGATVLELESPGSEARTDIRIPTACGVLTYTVHAVRTGSATADVTGTMDADRSRQEVERAVALDRCGFP